MSAIWVLSSSCGVAGLHLGDDAGCPASTSSCWFMVIQPVWRHGLVIEALAKQTFLRAVGRRTPRCRSSRRRCTAATARPGRPRRWRRAARPARRSPPGRTTPRSTLVLAVARRAASGSSSEPSVLHAVSSASTAADATAAPLILRLRITCSPCVRARVRALGGGCVSGERRRGAARARDGRRPTCQARPAAATATMMIRPCTVSRQVDATPRTVSSVKSSSSAKAPAAAESTQPRPPPSTHAAEDDRGDRGELVALADRGVHAGVPDQDDPGDGGRRARRA